MNDFGTFSGVNFNKLCRVCMNTLESNFISLFNSNSPSNSIFLASKIMTFTNLQVSYGDGLPHSVCLNCSQQIENAYLLKLQCEESDMTLRRYLTPQTITNSDFEPSFPEPSSDLYTAPCPKAAEADVKYECLECKKVFSKANELRNHKKTHRDYQCKLCSDVFNSSEQLVEHTKLHNSSKKTKDTGHVCTVCDCQYRDNNKLVEHMLNEHTEKVVHEDEIEKISEEHLVCNVCNKSYLKASNLAAHMGTHTGIKPYACNICGKCFTQGRAHACHMRTHSDTIEKPHQCGVCKKEFGQENQLSVHMKKHSGKSFVCNVCGKSYCNSGNLKSHMRLHTGDKPYACHICGKKFAQSNAHSYHMKTHTGDFEKVLSVKLAQPILKQISSLRYCCVH
ncbi:zinc finger protein OZF-like isoform X4 [Photinus pyralis]|uniref:zinc finger protein OZF-like isoform X4 n=1 Tax=Photinus pyralis TaxID=7054 RepID=UPI0012674B42|nr:zinc finger protein OZF-like isoform X4 [Photinus pyralis]